MKEEREPVADRYRWWAEAARERNAEDVVAPGIEQVQGVASCRVRGGAERQINVLLDLQGIQSRGMTSNEVVERIRAENLNIPAGDYDEGDRQIVVRTVGEFQSLEDIRNLSIGATADGTVIRLGEIAIVTDEVATRAHGPHELPAGGHRARRGRGNGHHVVPRLVQGGTDQIVHGGIQHGEAQAPCLLRRLQILDPG